MYAGAALIRDPDLLSVAQAWAHAEVVFRFPDEPPPLGSIRALWDWAWSGCDFDLSELAAAAGLTDNDTRFGFRRLSRLGLIYPDGTISDTVTTALGAHANTGIVEVR